MLAKKETENGLDITTTIDSELQEMLYRQFENDKSCSVAMNPFTGEILALVSTPSYDSNDFVLGMSQSVWDSLNEDEVSRCITGLGRLGRLVLPLSR